MATLADMRTRVQDYLIDVPTKTAAEIDNWINEALVALQDRHNFRWMEAEQSYTTAPNTRTLGAKNSDWKEARSDPWVHDGQGGAQLIRWAVSQGQMRALYSEDDSDDDTGPPSYVLERESDLEVYPFPDDNSLWDNGNYRVIVPYWKYLPELTADGDSNIVSNDRVGERALEYGAIAEGFLFNLDTQSATTWFSRAGIEIEKLILRDKKSYLHRRITLAPHPGAYGVRGARHRRRSPRGSFTS